MRGKSQLISPFSFLPGPFHVENKTHIAVLRDYYYYQDYSSCQIQYGVYP